MADGAAIRHAEDALEVGGVRLTHPDKVLYGSLGLSKLELANYYESVAGHMLPHLAQRPLSLVRCPRGYSNECFFQRHATESIPAGVDRVEVPEEVGSAIYLAANSLPALIGLVQMGVLELHTWGARADRLDTPDRIVFDLDPDPAVDWAEVVEAARFVRALLEDLGLRCFLKTTGGKGLHIVVPLARRHDWEEVKAFSRAVATHLAREAPQRFTAQLARAQRAGKIFVDYLRNAPGATAVAAFSTRARPGAPVSTPIAWDELDVGLRSDRYTVRNLGARLRTLTADPWQDYAGTRQSLTAAMRAAVKLVEESQSR